MNWLIVSGLLEEFHSFCRGTNASGLIWGVFGFSVNKTTLHRGRRFHWYQITFFTECRSNQSPDRLGSRRLSPTPFEYCWSQVALVRCLGFRSTDRRRKATRRCQIKAALFLSSQGDAGTSPWRRQDGQIPKAPNPRGEEFYFTIHDFPPSQIASRRFTSRGILMTCGILISVFHKNNFYNQTVFVFLQIEARIVSWVQHKKKQLTLH